MILVKPEENRQRTQINIDMQIDVGNCDEIHLHGLRRQLTLFKKNIYNIVFHICMYIVCHIVCDNYMCWNLTYADQAPNKTK